jgi:acyl phosphate:glycerol-3-phosphate acyltransferase
VCDRLRTHAGCLLLAFSSIQQLCTYQVIQITHITLLDINLRKHMAMIPPLMTTLSIILISYLLGCFSTAYYLVRWRTGQDIRTLGSGTAGARNVGRVLGKSGLVLIFVGDALKGTLAVLLAYWADLPPAGVSAALLAVVMGHLWPVQLGGRGGKGASTALGGVLVIHVWLGLSILGTALVLLALSRQFTRAGLIAIALTPLVAWLFGLEPGLVGGLVLLVALLLFAHRSSIMLQRLSSHSA